MPPKHTDPRIAALLDQMGMPMEQREGHIADLVGIANRILDDYFRELAEENRRLADAGDGAATDGREDPPADS